MKKMILCNMHRFSKKSQFRKVEYVWLRSSPPMMLTQMSALELLSGKKTSLLVSRGSKKTMISMKIHLRFLIRTPIIGTVRRRMETLQAVFSSNQRKDGMRSLSTTTKMKNSRSNLNMAPLCGQFLHPQFWALHSSSPTFSEVAQSPLPIQFKVKQFSEDSLQFSDKIWQAFYIPILIGSQLW